MAFDFPNSPTVDQEANGYVWDGEKWNFVFVVVDPPSDGSGPIGFLFLMMGVR